MHFISTGEDQTPDLIVKEQSELTTTQQSVVQSVGFGLGPHAST